MLLDTGAWIEVFKGTTKGQKVSALLRARECFTSAISLAEISAWIGKVEVERVSKINAVKHSSTLLGLDNDLLEKAGILKVQKRKHFPNFGLVDAIILATAKTHQLSILTGDQHFTGENTIPL